MGEAGREYAKVVWHAADVRLIRPDWSEQHAEAFLAQNAPRLQERLIQAGYDVLREMIAQEAEAPQAETHPPAVAPLPDSAFRTLTPQEEAEFRQQARDEYPPSAEQRRKSGLFHPVIRDEWDRLDREAITREAGP